LVATYAGLLAFSFVAGILFWELEAMDIVDMDALLGNDTATIIPFSERSQVGKTIYCISAGIFGPPYFAFYAGRNLLPLLEESLQAVWQALVDAVTTVVNFVVTLIVDAWVWVVAKVQAVWQALVDAVTTVVNFVITNNEEEWVWVVSIVKAEWEA
jgi:hypothetical protein